MSKFFGLDRIIKFIDIIRQNGGIRASYMKMYRYVKKTQEILNSIPPVVMLYNPKFLDLMILNREN